LVEVHPPALLREDGTTIPPQPSGIGAGVAPLQECAFPRRRRTLTMVMRLRRIPAETFTTPRHNCLWPVQGRNQDCRVRLHAITPPGVDSTSLKEPCRAYPRKCLLLLLFYPVTWSGLQGVAGYTEAHPCAWTYSSPFPLGSLTPWDFRHFLVEQAR
jgi:hypothetical protein